MTDAVLAACPACAAAPDAASVAPAPIRPGPLRRIEIALPAIHCAACITGVERTLEAEPGVAAARVNLTLKRAAVTVEDAPGVEDRLIAALDARGFEAHPLDSAALEATRSDAEGRDLLARIGVAGFASMNVMLLSVAVWAGATGATRDLMHWVSAAIALPAVAFAAQPFFRNAYRALRARRLDMDVPISTAILMALAVSLRETVLSGPRAFFEAAVMLTFFLLVGRYLSHLTRASARSAAAEIAALEVHMAERIRADGTRETVPLDAVRAGDVLAVAPGARVPVDGTVMAGRSEIDPSLLTGETMPEPVAPGSTLRAGLLNLTGPLEVRADALGDDTLLREIGRLVETAERSRGRYASLADRASSAYAPIVYLTATAALLVWGVWGGDWRHATNIAAAVLIITCPCGLGLAVPAVLTAASGRLFRQGVLLKDGEALEKLALVDAVVVDKTGTLTTGRPVLTNADAIAPRDLAFAAALAAGSSHPLSCAITRAATGRGVPPVNAAAVVEHPGLGSEGRIGQSVVRLGRAEWAGGTALDVTAAWLRIDTAPPVAFRFEDELRPEAPGTIARLRADGLPVTLLSGDSETPVAALADRLGLDRAISRATPAEKVGEIQALGAQGHRVLMIGDGLNDAAALAAAHVSISPASAVDASRSAADLIILGDRLDRAADALALARVARRRILENFTFAFAYNVVSVPLAFAGLVTPLNAAIIMSTSSLIVALNALRLGPRQPAARP
ncbi:Cu2+-exporting ATPase [Amaricoccus macauensis]|uniref:Cu2+-exporting ATPase n=1 Tax=Amaricoccus macauensis TaxID=57001 RepID=A0A840SNS5_9RHOB|nr:heavy metal translocating P-type ATPase [Amaricoccus macauensis]MBB5222245.1 Cu2+-exporting ATPase [Amaricoccus macauensis]